VEVEDEGLWQEQAQATRRLNREDIVRSTARSLADAVGIGVILALMKWLSLAGYPTKMYWLVFVLITLLLPLALYCYRLCARRPFWGSIVLVVILFAAATTAFLLVRVAEAACFFVIPVLASAALFGPVATSLTAVTSVAIVCVGFPAGRSCATPATLIVASAVVIWLILRPLHHLLDWSWQRYAEAIRLSEELQEQRGKLNRTMKALDLTNRLLQRTNHELALARREAEEARRLKEEFCANISHELRTPLNIILGFAEIMHTSPDVYGDFDWPRTLRRDIAEIHRNAGYISSLIDDILDLARMEAMRMPVKREQTNLLELIEEVVQIAQQLLRDKPVTLRVAVHRSLPELPLDRTRIRQVLLNLLNNAVRYTEHGSITVSTTLREDEVVVAVSDTGVGISQDELESIFDEYRQVNAWSEPGKGGKGLGLAIAKRFVQLHGGSIWVESEVGRGSTFCFSLPLTRKDQSRLSQSTPAPLPTNPYSPCLILLADDEAAAAYLERHLDGYEVVWLRELDQLEELVQSRHPEAVIVNVPPGVRELPLPLTQLPETLPCILCSLPVVPRAVYERHFVDFLVKPVSGEALLSALRSVEPGGDVLVVDDDRGFVQFVVRLLQTADADYQARWAYNGRDAIRKMRARRPDVVLLDVMMPEMSGFAVAERMRQDPYLADVPIVAVSGAGLDKNASRVRGSILTLAKGQGFNEGELIGVIRNALPVIRANYFMESHTRSEPSVVALARPAS